MKREMIYAFIDSQNLNLGTSKNIYKNGKCTYKGWKIDMKKFKTYLDDKFRTRKIFLFLGYIKENQKMYDMFKSFGYELIFKPTVGSKSKKPKGNVDAEIVLNASRLKYDEYDKAVFVSGDGDFYCLYEFLEKEGKLKNIIIPNKKAQSSLLERFDRYIVLLERDKMMLQRK